MHLIILSLQLFHNLGKWWFKKVDGHSLADSYIQQFSFHKEHHKFSSTHLSAVLGSSIMLGFKFPLALLIQLFSTIQFCCVYPLLFLRPFVLVVLRYYELPNLVFMNAFLVFSTYLWMFPNKFSGTMMYLSERVYQHCEVVLKLL